MAGHHHAGKGGATRLTTPQARESKDYAHVIGLFAEMAALPEDAPERERLRVHIIESCLPIAENIATGTEGAVKATKTSFKLPVSALSTP